MAKIMIAGSLSSAAAQALIQAGHNVVSSEDYSIPADPFAPLRKRANTHRLNLHRMADPEPLWGAPQEPINLGRRAIKQARALKKAETRLARRAQKRAAA